MKKSMKRVLGLALILGLILISNTIAWADTEKPSWTGIANMPTPRYYLQTEVIDGKIYAIGGLKDGKPLSSTEVYDPVTNSWTKLSPMSVTRERFQTEVINGKIYVIGGISSSGSLSSTEVYDPATNSWTTLAPMSEARYLFQTEVVNGKIYAIGGIALSSTEVYDPATNSWTTLAPMSASRTYFKTEVIHGKIYVIGGLSSPGRHFLASVEVYDPATNSWTTLASMSEHRVQFQTEVINGRIYAMGGNNKDGTIYELQSTLVSSTEVYDPGTNRWTTLASMSDAKYCFKTKAIDGKLYAIGGVGTKNKALSSAEVYDPETNSWTTLTPMSVGRTYFQTEAIDNKLYAIGGRTAPGNTTGVTEVYSVSSSVSTQIKVVLEENEKLQLSVDDHLNENTNMTWTSSNDTVAQVDANGVVTAIKAGTAVIHVKSQDGTYTDEITILVVENADDYRLAVDLQVGKTSRLTVDDLSNTFQGTWDAMDSTVATVSSKGVVTAKGQGLTVAVAKNTDGTIVGQVYIRVRV